MTAIAMGPMLFNISISALEPCASEPLAGVTSLSDCNAKRSAAVKIGIHLIFNGIRRDKTIQVISRMPPAHSVAARKARRHADHAMLRSERCCILVASFQIDAGGWTSEMLVELRAENYAVIDHAIAVFGPGLNLLTGETGAGKSILVDALALLMGGKASAELVRHGAERAVVACVFEATPGAEAILEENGIDSEGNEIILRREILSTGKGRVFINNQPATAAVLKLLAPELALVHAQSETLSSFDQAQQRILLDRFGGISTKAVNEAHAAWRNALAQLVDLEEGEQDRLRKFD